MGLPRVTLEGLIPFAQDCPHPKKLNIAINAEVPVPNDITQDVLNTRWQNCLTRLDLFSPPVGSTQREAMVVAAFLAAIFTNLTQFNDGIDGIGSC